MALKNVFVPLTTEAFNDFYQGKTFEVRKAERGWNRRQIYTGRGVTVSHGYSGQRRYGVIGSVLFDSLENICHKIPFQKIEPTAKNRSEAVNANRELLGASAEYVAFEVIFYER